MNPEIIKKIEELNTALEQHADKNAVSFELFITSAEVTAKFSTRSPAKLKREGVSMRNIAGEFIK